MTFNTMCSLCLAILESNQLAPQLLSTRPVYSRSAQLCQASHYTPTPVHPQRGTLSTYPAHPHSDYSNSGPADSSPQHLISFPPPNPWSSRTLPLGTWPLPSPPPPPRIHISSSPRAASHRPWPISSIYSQPPASPTSTSVLVLVAPFQPVPSLRSPTPSAYQMPIWSFGPPRQAE